MKCSLSNWLLFTRHFISKYLYGERIIYGLLRLLIIFAEHYRHIHSLLLIRALVLIFSIGLLFV